MTYVPHPVAIKNETTNPDAVADADDKNCRRAFETTANARGMVTTRHKADGLYVQSETEKFWEAFKRGWLAHIQSKKWF